MSALNNKIFQKYTNNNSQEYLQVAKKISLFHATNIQGQKELISEKSMAFYLNSKLHHVYFDEISLAIIQVVDFEAELITLMVDQKFRNKNIGTNLISKILYHLRLESVKKVFLEVSEKNIFALKLYRKAGFKKCGYRKHYYLKNRETSENALVMERKL